MGKLDTVLIVKGFGDPNPDRWQDHEEAIANSATEIGRVIYPRNVPDFQGEATPLVTDFIAFFCDLLAREGVDPEETIVLAHSLGGDGWLHLVKQMPEFKDAITRLIASPKENKTGYDAINNFFPEKNTVPTVQLSTAQQARWLVIGSDDDPVIHETPDVLATDLNVASETVAGGGHFMPHSVENTGHMDLGDKYPSIRPKFKLPY